MGMAGFQVRTACSTCVLLLFALACCLLLLRGLASTRTVPLLLLGPGCAAMVLLLS
jgi:hypothetical protein